MNTHSVSVQLGDNELKIESGKVAKLADGAVTVTLGETVLLVTAVSATSIRDGQSWFPMSVEYKERAAAAGRFPGGYFKREGRPTEKEILTCRMTDRPLRPMFPKGYLYDTQIIAILLSADGINDADIPAMNGASAALVVSDIPFAKPVGAVRVGQVDGQFIVNPDHDQRYESDLDLVYVGSKDEVIMIEGAADEIPEARFKEALHFAQEHVARICDAQDELRAKCGKEKREYEVFGPKQELLDLAYETVADRTEAAIYLPGKVERGRASQKLLSDLKEASAERFPDATPFDIETAFDYVKKKTFRESFFSKGTRSDGRSPNDLRPISAEVDFLPRAHGSALFTRGETQSLGTATLAPIDECQMLDNYAGGDDSKRFLLHYSFPPFSVGETGRVGGLNRREIGHGALAERSVLPILPDEADFPYALRVTSEITESNGSSSMATVCSATLALLDAGVPLKRPAAGISVGLVTEKDDEGKILKHETILDILGSEDFFGDMDFKMCGSSEGVTGFQLDLKLPGIPLSILEEGIDKAERGRKDVLAIMDGIISEPAVLSEHAPRIEMIKIDPGRIGELIGPGGKMIKAIQAESGAEINIEDDGSVHIYAIKRESLERALEMVGNIFAEVEVDKLYTGPIVSITKFGAFMQVLPGKDGLIHVSELAEGRVEYVEDVVKQGDVVTAMCIGVDDKGRVKMSLRAAQQEQGGGDQGGNEGNGEGQA